MVLGLVEHDRGVLNKSSLEMLTFGRRHASELDVTLEAILIGENARALAEGLSYYGVSRVHLVLDDRLDEYAPDAWARSVAQLIDQLDPLVVLAAGTERGNELLARVGAMRELPMAANCVEVRPGEPYLIKRVRWGGSLLEEALLSGQPKLLTVAQHTIPAEETPTDGELDLHTVTPTLDERDFRVRVKQHVGAIADTVSLADAQVVVGGGRGVGSAEGFANLDRLAALLHGTVGCSRAVTNQGWRPHSDQIGQTGTRIAPDLYVACGISGAVQHMVGCKGSKKILVINTDPEAPIISKADYVVIGDLHEVVPALIAEISNANQA